MIEQFMAGLAEEVDNKFMGWNSRKTTKLHMKDIYHYVECDMSCIYHYVHRNMLHILKLQSGICMAYTTM